MDVKKGNDGPQSLNIYYGIKANFAKHWQPKRMARVDSVIARGHVDKILSTLPDHRKLALFLFIAHNGAESVIIRPIRNKPLLSEQWKFRRTNLLNHYSADGLEGWFHLKRRFCRFSNKNIALKVPAKMDVFCRFSKRVLAAVQYADSHVQFRDAFEVVA